MALGTPSWLNVDFTEGILRRSEGDNSIQVIDIFSKAATSKGDNYTSDMIRVQVEFTRNQGDKRVTEKKSIILKLSPMEEGIRQDLIAKCEIFDTEISMMTCTLKKMNELLAPENRLSARALHVQREHPAFLVIEDLAPLGFRMADREAGLDLPHCILAIQGLARFHATSIAVCEKDQSIKTQYTKGIFRKNTPSEMTLFFVAAATCLAEEVKSWPEYGERYGGKLSALVEHLYDKGVEASMYRENDFNVLTHGDFWVNNMLFRYDNKGKPVQHICVDFQMCMWTSPAVDLLYFLSTSASDVSLASKDAILEEYLRTLSGTMKKINCKTQPPTMAELKKSMKERAVYGMIASFTILPIVLFDKSKAVGLEELMQKDGTYNNPSYKGETYGKILRKRLPEYDAMGLLEI